MTSDPPAVLRLPPHRTLLSLGPTARLIGLDPDDCVVVDDLPAALGEMLDELRLPAERRRLVAGAVERGAAPAAAESLLDDLLDAGALVDSSTAERRERRRSASTVVVVGRGPLAVAIVTGLVHAGVGAVHTDTGGTVRAVDLGTGYQDVDQGRDRFGCTRAAVRRLVPAGTTTPPPLRLVPDLVVLADNGVEPVRSGALMADAVAHLPARLRDGIGVVGPLVLPGRSACLGCLELHRCSRDPYWPAVAARLAGQCGHADPSCGVATAGLATAQALVALDGEEPAALDATLELDVAAGTLLRRVWTPHPECHCRSATAGLSIDRVGLPTALRRAGTGALGTQSAGD